MTVHAYFDQFGDPVPATDNAHHCRGCAGCEEYARREAITEQDLSATRDDVLRLVEELRACQAQLANLKAQRDLEYRKEQGL